MSQRAAAPADAFVFKPQAAVLVAVVVLAMGVLLGALMPQASSPELLPAAPVVNNHRGFVSKRLVPPKPPKSAWLKITGPRGARVWIDDVLQPGRAPMQLKLSPGKYGVRTVRKRRQRAFVVEVEEGQHLRR